MEVKRDKYKSNIYPNIIIDKKGLNIEIDLKLTEEDKRINLNATITGVVIDGLKNPIKNAVINLMDDNFNSLTYGTTDENGIYLINNIPYSKSYNLLVASEGKLNSEKFNFSILPKENMECNFVLLNNPSKSFGVISGVVQNNYDEPIFGAIIFLFSKVDSINTLIAITYTDISGIFTFSEISLGNYSIIIDSLAYVEQEISTIVLDEEITSISVKLNTNINSAEGIISGVIRDDLNDIIADADVILYSINGNNSIKPIGVTKTNQNGIYTFINVFPGDYLIKTNKSEEINVATVESNLILTTNSNVVTFTLATGELAGGAGYANSGFVNGIGGPENKSSSTTKIIISKAGQYTLSINYVSGQVVSPLKIDINGINTGNIYQLPATSSWEVSNAKTFTVPIPINLLVGSNTLKFYSDGINWGPDIGTCFLNLIENKIKINTFDKGNIVNKFNFIGTWNDRSNEIWTNNNNSNFSLNFNGVSIILMGIKDPNHGIYQISIDGGVFNEVDAYSVTRTSVTTIFDSGLLNYGNHTLNFKLKGINPHGGRIDAQINYALVDLGGSYTNLIVKTLEKGSDLYKFDFIGTWNDGIDEIWTNSNSSSFLFNFNGVSIILMGIKDPNHGVYQISIDGGVFNEVDAYSITRTSVTTIFDSGLLNYGNHTLNFKLKGINPHGGRIDGQISYSIINLGSKPITDNFQSELFSNENNIMSLSDNWKFNLNDDITFSNTSFDDESWRILNLPHDWSIELNFNKDSAGGSSSGFLDGGVAWYRKAIKLPTNIIGKKVFIYFDGIYVESSIYVNGVKLGENQNGFTPFYFEITNALYFDDRSNFLSIKVSNSSPSCRWYSGSGIYRNVNLLFKNKIYIDIDGIFVTTPSLKQDLLNTGNVKVNIKTTLNNEFNNYINVKIIYKIYSQNNTLVSSIENNAILSVGTNIIEQNLIVSNPALWDIYNGDIYEAEVTIISNDKLIDIQKVNFGFRYFNFDSNTGFWLNGKNVKIKGVCIHHDLGALGAAINYDAIKRQIRMIKSMGANAIRLTHNPTSPELIKICENEGILLVEEAFDCWEISKRKYDYARFFNQYAKRDIQRMVNRSKNSPAIIMWSIGNEIPDTNTIKGVTIAKNLISWIKELDTTRPITMGEDKYRTNNIDGDPSWNDNINAVMDILDLVGYNYSEKVYDVHHKAKPNWKMYGSEVSSAVRSRGVYLDATNTLINDSVNLQVTSYDNYNSIIYWGRSAEEAWRRDRDRQFIAGSFVWTAFDYIGEPTPFDNTYPAKSSYFGAIDTAGFAKDAYYIYQSQWSTEPMIHILPHWNWSQGTNVLVWIYSNVPTVELLLNDISLGQKSFISKTTNYGLNYLETSDGKLHLEWQVPFISGKLKALGIKNGKIVAVDSVVTATVPFAVKLIANKKNIIADGKSLSYITANIIDSNGQIVPIASNLIQFEVIGATIVGVDNGNPSSIENFKNSSRSAFNGKALLIIQSIPGIYTITVSATSPGLKSHTININGQLMKSEQVYYNLDSNSILENGATLGSGTSSKYISNIGGQKDGALIVTIMIEDFGDYQLTLLYRNEDSTSRNMRVEINGINFDNIYLFLPANPGEFKLNAFLKYGINTIKFHGDGFSLAPDIGMFYISSITSFSIAKQLGKDSYSITSGIMENGAKLGKGALSRYVTNLGGINNGSITLIVNVKSATVYKLLITYINEDFYCKNMLIDVNGVGTGTLYSIPPANSGVFNTFVILKEGENHIKFYGDNIDNAPNISIVSLSVPSNLTILGNKINGAIAINSGAIGYIGGKNDGAILINYNASQSGKYNLFVIVEGISNLAIDINNINTGTIYNISEINPIMKVYVLTLVSGNNIIKLHGDGINNGPNLYYAEIKFKGKF